MSRRTRVPRRPTAHQSLTTPMPAPNERINTNGQLTWLRVDKLDVDPWISGGYQRGVNLRKVAKIVKDFDPDAIGTFYISRRDDGTNVIIDGQQRQAVLMHPDVDWGDQRVPCQVFTGLTRAQEASLYRKYNELRTKPKPLDLHMAAVCEKDKRALAIERVLADNGLRFSNGPVHGSIASVATIQKIYDNAGLRILEKTIGVSLKSWGTTHEGLRGEILEAIAVVLARHGGQIDDGRLVSRLSKMDPSMLVRKATALKRDLGLATGSNSARSAGIIAALIIGEYNRRLKEDDRIVWNTEATGPSFWKVAS